MSVSVISIQWVSYAIPVSRISSKPAIVVLYNPKISEWGGWELIEYLALRIWYETSKIGQLVVVWHCSIYNHCSLALWNTNLLLFDSVQFIIIALWPNEILRGISYMCAGWVHRCMYADQNATNNKPHHHDHWCWFVILLQQQYIEWMIMIIINNNVVTAVLFILIVVDYKNKIVSK